MSLPLFGSTDSMFTFTPQENHTRVHLQDPVFSSELELDCLVHTRAQGTFTPVQMNHTICESVPQFV